MGSAQKARNFTWLKRNERIGTLADSLFEVGLQKAGSQARSIRVGFSRLLKHLFRFHIIAKHVVDNTQLVLRVMHFIVLGVLVEHTRKLLTRLLQVFFL